VDADGEDLYGDSIRVAAATVAPVLTTCFYAGVGSTANAATLTDTMFKFGAMLDRR